MPDLAKSKNHATHHKSCKQHWKGIRKPCYNEYLKRIDPKFLRNMCFTKNYKKSLKKTQANTKVICEHAEASKASGSLRQLSPRCHRAPALAVIAHPELGKEFQRSMTNCRKPCQPKPIQMLSVATAPAQDSQWCPGPAKAPLKGVCLPV
ncbi:hypothetical protein U0070_022031 [Myodes glareolus]|uniref:60S ribosomal protein L29 n=1 Tax=Myodes glareolus TaxID=447135 RepID=A0AAW0I7V8_MYOGA